MLAYAGTTLGRCGLLTSHYMQYASGGMWRVWFVFVHYSKPLSAEMVREVAQSARAGQLVDAPSPAGSGVPPRCGVAASSMSSSPCSSPSSTPPCMSRSGSLSTPTQAALQDWLPASAVPFLHHMAAALGGGAQGPQAVAAYA